MTSRFGPHGVLVARFLDAVRAGGLDWQRVVDEERGPGRRAAVRAVGDARWPAALLSAVDRAGLDTYGSLGLTRDDFAHPLDLGSLKVAICVASKAVAVRDQLDAAVLADLLGPFARQGVTAAQEVLDAAAGGTVTGSGPEPSADGPGRIG